MSATLFVFLASGEGLMCENIIFGTVLVELTGVFVNGQLDRSVLLQQLMNGLYQHVEL